MLKNKNEKSNFGPKFACYFVIKRFWPAPAADCRTSGLSRVSMAKTNPMGMNTCMVCRPYSASWPRIWCCISIWRWCIRLGSGISTSSSPGFEFQWRFNRYFFGSRTVLSWYWLHAKFTNDTHAVNWEIHTKTEARRRLGTFLVRGTIHRNPQDGGMEVQDATWKSRSKNFNSHV